VFVYSEENCPQGITPSSFFGATGCAPVQGIGQPSSVAVVDHNTITFNFPAGNGGGYDVLVDVGNQSSGVSGDNKFAYQVPIVDDSKPAVQPLALPISDTRITITGRNFGIDESKVDVSIGGRMCDRSTIRLFPFRNNGVVTGLGEIYVNIPFGAGNNLPVLVHVAGRVSEAPANGTKKGTFSYTIPVVNYTTPVPTEGSVASGVPLSIFGWNFGPTGNVSQVMAGGQVCGKAKVTEKDKVITCEQPAGMGKELDVFVRIAETSDTQSQDTGLKKFAYEAPIVTNVNPASGKVGDYITITGRNFGLTSGALLMCVVGPEGQCWNNDNNEMVKLHTKFYAQVPVGFGSNRAIRVSAKGLLGPATTDVFFSYAAPQVKAAKGVPTSGGTLRVIGKEFGPTNSSAFDSVTVRDSNGNLIQCASPRVVVADTDVDCDLPAGIGKDLEVQVSVGGQKSNWEKVFSYDAPIINNIEPATAAAGETVTVTGANFGINASHIRLTLFKQVPGGGLWQLPVPVNLSNVATVQPHTKISFTAPLGAGPELTLRVTVPVYGTDTSYSRISQSAVPVEGASTTFSYARPVIETATPVPTTGGVTTITGKNFGPAGSSLVNSVILRKTSKEMMCTDATVTVDNTQLTCTIGAGSGLAYDMALTIFNQTNNDGAKYAFQAPVVDSVQPGQAKPGDLVTITGKNFGTVASDITVALGNAVCRDVAMLAAHTSLSCTVPASEGKGQPAVATVAQLSGSRVGAGLFTYSKSGCTADTAENYDRNATSDDGSCQILGCTKATAFNYNPEANKDDGLCEDNPIEVTMRIKLDYAVYLSDKTNYETKFVAEVARNLNISESRIQIVNVTKGSVVFTFKIYDKPSSRAAAAAQKLEQQVISNKWQSEYTLLTLEVKGSSTGTVKTKADEPVISMDSIIGVSVGFSLIVIWLLLWRRCMTACAERCFKSVEADDSLMEVQVYSNPLPQSKLPGGYEKYEGKALPPVGSGGYQKI